MAKSYNLIVKFMSCTVLKCGSFFFKRFSGY